MKYSNYYIIFALIFGISGCTSTVKPNTPIIIEVTQAVTHIMNVTVQVTQEVTKEVTRSSKVFPPSISSTIPTLSCYDTAVTQGELDQCAGEKMEKQKTLLNSLLIELKGRLDSQEYDNLLLVQTKWESFVEDHCRWEESFFEGGTMAPMEYAQCIANEYKQRINELRYYLCEVGGPPDCEASLRYKQ